MTAELPTPSPPINPETQRFWSGAAEHKLLLPRCNSCQTVIWYPRTLCSNCGSRDVNWFEASGRGSIYTFTICRRGAGDYRAVGAFVLAYVELEEGPRIMTNIVDSAPESLAIGQSVEVVFHDTTDGLALPRFRPIDDFEPNQIGGS